jgi:hypothetical protein
MARADPACAGPWSWACRDKDPLEEDAFTYTDDFNAFD